MFCIVLHSQASSSLIQMSSSRNLSPSAPLRVFTQVFIYVSCGATTLTDQYGVLELHAGQYGVAGRARSGVRNERRRLEES